MKLRAVMDTNVLVSGVLWRGVPFELLRLAEENSLTIYTSLDIMAEEKTKGMIGMNRMIPAGLDGNDAKKEERISHRPTQTHTDIYSVDLTE